MRIECPCCGLRDHSEFDYGGDALRTRPALDDKDIDRWSDYVFLRHNPRGPHREFWQHISGCRQWIVVERDTLTHKIRSVQLAANAPGIGQASEETNDG